eukprot:TRINITY_DN2719_c0_g1_i1.p1 TRINITY_DN2719_c0_g1~~TRINITY_DN2719_c0_g1_i1.p1  ORF type:complete len:636 (+),score=141.62 TRINITY_DN2719_c0_g1_i1:60-1967(+)
MANNNAFEIKGPELEGGDLNMLLLKNSILAQFTKLMKTTQGKVKHLILDPSLVGPLGQLTDIDFIKKLGIDKLYYLNEGAIGNTETVIYITRPKVSLVNHIVEQIRCFEQVNYYIYFVPQRRLLCDTILQDAGVLDSQKVTLGEFHLYSVPLEKDLLYMDLDKDFRYCSLEGDRTPLFYTAKGLMQIQSAYGFIPKIYGKGSNSYLVVEMLERMRREKISRGDEIILTPEIETLILLDREVDLITPMSTQLTYQGIIDEVFGIFNGTVELPAEMVIDPKAENKDPSRQRMTILLNSNDKTFLKLRDLNFSVVGKLLNQKAKEIEEFYEKRKTAQTTENFKNFTKDFPTYQKEHGRLRIHTNITESILDLTRDQSFRTLLEAEQNLLGVSDPEQSLEYIEECINKQESLIKVLRLIALYNFTNSGFEANELNSLKRDIVQTYGYKYLFTLENLSKLGMFNLKNSSSSYSKLKDTLNLFKEDINDVNDISHLWSGYAPISIRLIETLLNGFKTNSILMEEEPEEPVGPLSSDLPNLMKPSVGWGSQDVDRMLKECPGGPAFRMRQKLPTKGISINETPSGKKVIFIFFIGGCTFSEISALRFLSEKNEEYSFVIGTTKLINGNSLIESLIEKFSNED